MYNSLKVLRHSIQTPRVLNMTSNLYLHSSRNQSNYTTTTTYTDNNESEEETVNNRAKDFLSIISIEKTQPTPIPQQLTATLTPEEDVVNVLDTATPFKLVTIQKQKKQQNNAVKTKVFLSLRHFLIQKHYDFTSLLAFLNESCDHSLFIHKVPGAGPLEPKYVLYLSPEDESIYALLIETLYSLLVSKYQLQKDFLHIPIFSHSNEFYALVDMGDIAIKFAPRSHRAINGIELNGNGSRREQYLLWNEISLFKPSQFLITTNFRVKEAGFGSDANVDDVESITTSDYLSLQQ